MKYFRNLIVVVAVMTISMVQAKTNPSNDPSGSSSTTSSISGQVSDQMTGESLAGVMVMIEGTDFKVYSDLDGKFTINNIQPGSYDLVLTMISYNNSLVEDLKVEASEAQNIEVKLTNRN